VTAGTRWPLTKGPSVAMKSFALPKRRFIVSMRMGLVIALILSFTQSVVVPTTAQAVGNACPATNYLPGTTGAYPDIFGNFASYLKSNGVYYKVNKITGEAMAVGIDSATVSNLVVPETITISSSIIQSAGFDSTSANCVAFVKEYKVRYIGEGAFATQRGAGSNWPVLSSVTINAQIKSIAPYAFANQCKVSSLVIPDSVTDIGESAFWFMNTDNANTYCSSGDTGLQTITFGINLKRMAQQTFQADGNLTSINFRGQVFTTTNANNELVYPSSYDVFDFNTKFPTSRVQNTCLSMFPYVFATVSVLAGSSSGWTDWGTASNCLDARTNYSGTITTAPSKVANPVASNPTQSSAQVAFTAPFNGGSAITGYRVTSVPGGFTATLNGAAADTVTVTGLSAATNYKFFVVAINANGDSSESELSNQITTGSLTVPALTISPASETVSIGSSIAGYSITNSGGAATSYSISPSETNTPGISFNTSTGLITGAPTTVASARTYTISASNGAGSSTSNGSFTITVVAASSSSPAQSNSIPSPPQTSSIAAISTQCLDGVNTIRLTGVFTARISNIALNSVNLKSTQWDQTASTVDVRPSTALSSQLLIQIYNGQIPLLAEQTINFVNACLVAAPTPASSATPKPTPTPTPAPTPTPIVNVQPESTMKLVATFYFPLNSYLVNAANRTAIVGEAERIMSSSAKTVLIYGNTDSQGGVDNVWLSKQRATAVRKELRPLLSGKKIQLGWFADTRPAVKGKSQAAYAKNRRVEIWVK